MRYIGGMSAQATHAMNEWWGKSGMGTMPHALIQMFNGDVVEAAKAYHKKFPEDELVVLIDYNNDVITDARVAREFGSTLKGVRVDTSIRHPEVLGTFDPRGVNPSLVFALRKALDEEGFQHVDIVVTGGFDEKRIREFEAQNVPVDIYG